MVLSSPCRSNQTNMQKASLAAHTRTDTYLLDAVLVHGLLLVQARESTVVALIQSPVLRYGNPQLVRLLKSQEQRLDGALQARRVRSIKLKALRLDKLSAIPRLLNAYS